MTNTTTYIEPTFHETTYTLAIRGKVVAGFFNIREASETRERLWEQIEAGRSVLAGADDFRDREHFIECTTIGARATD